MTLLARLPALIAPVMLILAWGDWPYGYYQLLRVVITIAALWLLVPPLFSDSSKPWKNWTLGIIILLFNPLLPIHLSREIWAVIDPLAAVALTTVIFSKPQRNH